MNEIIQEIPEVLTEVTAEANEFTNHLLLIIAIILFLIYLRGK